MSVERIIDLMGTLPRDDLMMVLGRAVDDLAIETTAKVLRKHLDRDERLRLAALLGEEGR
jgi:hypothetical protein